MVICSGVNAVLRTGELSTTVIAPPTPRGVEYPVLKRPPRLLPTMQLSAIPRRTTMSRRPHLGLHLQLSSHPRIPERRRFEDATAQAVAAERLGFESVWPVEQ